MKLGSWLKSMQLTHDEFAQKVRRDRSTVSRWVSGKRKPSFDDLREIDRETGGAVTANDFLDDSRVDGECPDCVGQGVV